jgi:hypothetical protein
MPRIPLGDVRAGALDNLRNTDTKPSRAPRRHVKELASKCLYFKGHRYGRAAYYPAGHRAAASLNDKETAGRVALASTA